MIIKAGALFNPFGPWKARTEIWELLEDVEWNGLSTNAKARCIASANSKRILKRETWLLTAGMFEVEP
jgi:hypothetical protein